MSVPRRLLLARDHHPDLLRQGAARGELARLRRGAYLATGQSTPSPDSRGSSPAPSRAGATGPRTERETSMARIQAVHAALRAPHVFSHTTAALLWGLRLWDEPTQVHVRQGSRASARHSDDIVRHLGLPTSGVELDGLPATSLLQTVLDCVRTLPPLEGLVVADSALSGNFPLEEARERLTGQRGQRGVARALMVLGLADGGAESAWETWLRYQAVRIGLPRPQTQWVVRTHLGDYRTDVAWPAFGVVAEFDGAVKYEDGAFGRRSSGRDALVEEKRREDAITEALGSRPLRVMAKDARDPAALARRLLARFPRDVRNAARADPRLPER